ncbi:hypothetical protein SAMN04487980_100770 [Streptomyces sp. cf124]|uniref:hypothetical protein n=1 Tax=Streptomyces sp. cf124 TaxID=1761903 RepID=UPI0008E16A0C|nr:hypothetical protein [Streptomyces sp. cf124]SFM89696.1 hypothetical protein SAMN04487980_100770 [Streptomyces sp. cf124]
MRTRFAWVALATGLAIAGCGSAQDDSSDTGAQSDEPVTVKSCGASMEIQATNDFPDPTAYFIQLYWFDATGRQVRGIKMTTDGIAPGKTITFTVHGSLTNTEEWMCDVKVLGTQ